LLYLGAAICLLPLVLRRRMAGLSVFPADARNRRNLLGAILFGGVIGPVLLLLGLKFSLAASVSMWLNLEAAATAVLAMLLFREHLGKWAWIGNAGIVAAGVMLSFGQGWSGWIGLACVAGAAIAWGLDNNLTAIIDGISPEDSTFWKGLIAGSTNLAIGLVIFDWRVGTDWLWAMLLGGLSYGISIALYIRAAQGLGATRSQMIFASAPFFGVVLSVVWLGESLGILQIAAAVVLIGSIVLMFLDRHEHTHRHESMVHEHEHRHGEKHHDHPHGSPTAGAHSHVHEHAPVVHSHPHWPDLHHRHHGKSLSY
jgi:drug/metabolite transporter (DMT)-like permease